MWFTEHFTSEAPPQTDETCGRVDGFRRGSSV
jgi:hypothetical protein